MYSKTKYNLKSLSYYIAFVVLTFAIFGCEGIDDWSDLKNTEIFPDTNKTTENTNTFKRYSIPQLSSQPLVEYITDNNNKVSVFYSNEYRKVCDYTKLPFNSLDIKDFNSSLRISETTRVISLFDTSKLNDSAVAKLLEFVSNGGTLFIFCAIEDHRMSFLYGFKPEAQFNTDIKSSGWLFTTSVLPNIRIKTYQANMPQYGFAADNFSDKIKVLATAVNNSKYPAILENKVGDGKVILYNSTMDFLKPDRGFLFVGILKGLESVPYPIANVGTIFLDDFPSPLYQIKKEPIASEMNLTMDDFVKKVWWPDMLTIAKEFNISYSAMTVFDYTNKVVPPFGLNQWNSVTTTVNNKTEPLPDWFVKDVKAKGHEVAFHGYNHVSFEYKLWKNQEFIATCLNAVKKKWKNSDFGDLPTSYVPPSNIIDKKGITELKKAMPSLKYLCSLYLGDTEDGGNREFDYDPYNKDFFDYPRISSGFYLNDDEKYIQQSITLFTGIWTHFVHPDDVFQTPSTANASAGKFELRNRSNYGWRKTKGSDKSMYSEFRKEIKQIKSTYSQIRFLNANDAAKIVIDWRASRYTHKSENGLFTINEINTGSNKNKYWLVYVKSENSKKIETELNKQKIKFGKTFFTDGYLYNLHTNDSKISLTDFNLKFTKNKIDANQVFQSVKSDLNKFLVLAKKFQTGDDWYEPTAKELKLELESIKKELFKSPTIDYKAWNNYANKTDWNEIGDLWKSLEEYCIKYPTKENVMYSKELDKVIGYPNDLIKEKWLSAQLLVTPNDKDLLNTYVASFYTEENQEKIKKALQSLLAVDTSSKSYKSYIKYLIEFKKPEALKELYGKKPCEDFSELATGIVWLYADDKQYRKAYDWSAFSNEIDFATKMGWLIELKENSLLEKEYASYIEEHPNDYAASAIMSSYYLANSKLKEAWALGNQIPESEATESELRKSLNGDVIYANPIIQKDLIENNPELFYPEVLETLKKENRKNAGDFVDLNSSLLTNKKNTAIQTNVVSYNHFDNKNNIHSISGTYNKYYKQEFIENDKNFDNSLSGIQYKFSKSQIEGKPQFWSRARIEIDKLKSLYYEFGFGINKFTNKVYKAAEFNIFPVETAPGLNQKIYQMRLNLYEDFYLMKNINASISLQGDYYTKSLLTNDSIPDANGINYLKTTYGDTYEGSATIRVMYNNGKLKKNKFIPFFESQATQASRDLENGYPYWVIKNRLNAGLGLNWQFKNKNFESKIDASYFLDNYSNNFQRFTGNFSYQLFDFTALTANVEVFAQTKFYTNSLQMGIKYNLKRKRVPKFY